MVELIMKYLINCRSLAILIIFLFFGICLFPISITQTINQTNKQNELIMDGQILYSPIYSKKTYLIDRDGEINHSWSSDYTPGQSVYITDNGGILRTIRLSIMAPGGGAGGGIQKITREGTINWDFTYYTDDYLSHHDIEELSNGNILMIAWDYRTRDEAIEAGRRPNTIIGNLFYPDHIIEVKPIGPTTGDIIWEWYAWDHLIQDYDPTKNNYGVVEEHPELIDINFGDIDAGTRSDWLHTNSIDYNEEFDQILLSVHNFNEIWIIDHSTTTEEAAGHTGGNSGKGGDLLYRWGNPKSYRAGDKTDQKFHSQHDATWIDSGYSGEGNILVFNNGVTRPEGQYSSIDEIVPPVDNNGTYYLESGSAYGPDEQLWIYTSKNPKDFYSHYASGAQRLSDGNTLICDAAAGRFFEVTPEKETVWDYVNPYPYDFINHVFKIQYLPPFQPQPGESDLDCIGNLGWTNVKAGEIVKGTFQVKNIGATGSLLNWTIESFPNWGTWSFDPESGKNLTPEDEAITVQVSIVTPPNQNTIYEGYVKIVNQDNPKDFDIIPIYVKTPKIKSIYDIFLDFLYHKPILMKIFEILKYLF
jgi:hypothetical protein